MKLLVLHSEDPSMVGRELEIEPPGEATIGRDPGCTIVLPGASISRRHARLTWTGEAWIVHDTGSTHGIRLGHEPVHEARLTRGARLWIGNTLLGVDHEVIVETRYTTSPVDGLTGVANRRHVLEQLAVLANPAILRFDITGLYRLNHEHGHAAIDQLLVELAARLRAESPPGALVGRVGGDDFVVVLAGAGLAEARAIGAAIRERVLARPFGVVQPRVALGVALGRVEALAAAEADLSS